MLMKRTALAILLITIVTLSAAAWIIHNQISELQNQIGELQAQNSELKDQSIDLQDQIRDLELENREKQDRLADFTHELAKTRHLYVKLTAFQWGSSGPIVGLLIQYQARITVQNNDVIPVSGLTLTLNAVHKDKGTQIGEAGVTRIGRLNAGETYEISGWFYAMVGTSFEDVVFYVTLSIGDIVLEEKTTSELPSFPL